MDLRLLKYILTTGCQFILFMFLWGISFVGAMFYSRHARAQYPYYPSKFDRLINFQLSSLDNCTDLPDFSCSIRMDMCVYVFWTKFFVLYYWSIIIAMVYTWHRTIRFFSCFLVFFVLIVLIVGTDLILYFHRIVPIGNCVCLMLLMTFSSLEILMPHILEDPLSVLCGHHKPLDDRYEYLQNDTSRPARFYRWAKEMKKRWNIEEEKLIITTVVGIIMSVLCIILCIHK